MRFFKTLICAALAAALAICAGCGGAIDYGDERNWAYFEEGAGKAADLFLVCPTVDMGKNGNLNMSLTDEKTKANFVGALNMERGIYDETLTLYAPFYRQSAFTVYSLPQEKAERCMDAAYRDVRAAFLSFAAGTQGRPFVLAGFSQGSDMVLRLLKEFFDDERYQERLVAAYCIGWRVTEAETEQYPWLKMAEGADDTGVIVSFNTEAEGVTESLIVPKGVKTLGINPLNWKTDGKYAGTEENLGACFTDYEGNIAKETPELTGAYIDQARGTLIAPDIDPADYSNSLFPDGVYHLYDYQFFYRNLQENVALRTQAYLSEMAEEAA